MSFNDTIIWFFSISVFVWWITLIDFQIFTPDSCEIYSWCTIHFYVSGFNLLCISTGNLSIHIHTLACHFPFCSYYFVTMGFPGGSIGKEHNCNAGDTTDTGSILGLGRSPEEEHGSPLHYSCLENPLTEEPGGLCFMGSQRVGRDPNDWARILRLTLCTLRYRLMLTNPGRVLSLLCVSDDKIGTLY